MSEAKAGHDPFARSAPRSRRSDDLFSRHEVMLANRNSGLMLEMLAHDVTPIGAHYLLTHFDVPPLDRATHALQFADGFEAPFSLTMAEIEALPSETHRVTMECAGNGRAGHADRAQSMPWTHEAVGTAEWTGTPLLPLLERARPKAGTLDIIFTGADRGFDKAIEHDFARSLNLEQIETTRPLLVHAMNGQPLPPQHGAPLRLVVPGWYGMASVKWLARIDAIDHAFQGVQQVGTYRYRRTEDDPGGPVTTMRVRSLMVPPGLPDWLTRRRLVRPGPVTLQGRAWVGGDRGVARVEVDCGDGWREAELLDPVGPRAWRSWRFEWHAEPGEYALRCRATDDRGDTQPLDPPRDIGGFGNNAVQSVHVTVRADAS